MRRRGRDDSERGAVLIVTALSMTLLVLMASFAIDLGGRAQQKRQDQLIADMAALDAVRGISTSYSSAQTLANTSLGRNQPTGAPATTITTFAGGTYTAAGGFSLNTDSPTPCSTTACNAVKVIDQSTYHDFFTTHSATLSATAVAELANLAQFSVGATLADVNLGLGKLGTVNLTAVGYQGLATTNASLSALGTAFGLSGAALTPTNILAISPLSVSKVATALLTLAPGSGSAYFNTLVGSWGANYTSTNAISLGTLLGLTSSTAGLNTSVNLMQVLAGEVEIADQKAAVYSNLSVALPAGLTSITETISAIQPPTVSNLGTVCPSSDCATATNTQVTVSLTIKLNVSVLGLGLVAVTLPLNLQLGGATGDLTAINCTGTTPSGITVSTAFSNVALNVGAGAGVTLLGLSIGTLGGSIAVPSNTVSSTTPAISYPADFVPNQPSPAPTATSNPSAPAMNLTGGGVSGGLVAATLNLAGGVLAPVIGAVLANLDTSLVAVGVHVGDADYLGYQAQCGVPTLVQ